MPTIRELKEDRANLVAQARELIDLADKEKRNLTDEEEQRYDRLMNDVNDMAVGIQRREKLEQAEATLGESTEPESRQDETLSGTENNEGNLPSEGRGSEAYRSAYDRWLSGGPQNLKVEEVRALQADADTLGGYLLTPTPMMTQLIKELDDAVYIRQWATKHQVERGADGLGAPSLDADPDDGEWTAELKTGSDDDKMKFGKRELKPHPLAKRILISRKLLRKVPSVEGLVNTRLAYKISTPQEKAFLTGNGSGQPLGVFTKSKDGISENRDVSEDNTTTEITFDGLQNAKYKLKVPYWRNARWLFHRDGVKQLAKIKDGDGQYMWRESVRVGEPDRLSNFPVFMSEFAPNTFTTKKYVGILGDFSHYWIADDLGYEIQRLVELYALSNQIGFIGRIECDGMPVLEEAFVRIKLA